MQREDNTRFRDRFVSITTGQTNASANRSISRHKGHDSGNPTKRRERQDSDTSETSERHNLDSHFNSYERQGLDIPLNRSRRQDMDSSYSSYERHESYSTFNGRQRQDSDSDFSRYQRQESDSVYSRRQRQDSDNTFTSEYGSLIDSQSGSRTSLQPHYSNSQQPVPHKNDANRRCHNKTYSIRSFTNVNIYGTEDQGRDLRSVPSSFPESFKIHSTTHGNILKTTDRELKQHKQRDVSVKMNCKALNLAYARLSEHKVLIITGHQGVGKTFLGYELLNFIDNIEKDHPHYEWKRPVILHNPWDWSVVVSPSENVVVFLDDIFGPVTLNQTKAENWEHIFDTIWTCAKSGSVLVVMAMRNYILKEYCSCNLHNLFQEKHHLDLSSDPRLELNPEIKSIMLRKHLLEPVHSLSYHIEICDSRQKENWTGSPYKISEEFISDIAHNTNECPVPGSPLKYKLFAQVEQFLRKGKEIFEKPVACLKHHFLSFYSKERVKFLLLAAVWFSGEDGLQRSLLKPTNLTDNSRKNADGGTFEKGQITVAKLHRFAELFGVDKKDLVTIGNAESCLRDCFLVVDFEKDALHFSHEAIGEAVCLALGTKHLDLVIKDCSLDLLLDYVQTEEISTNEYSMTVTVTDYNMLAQRFLTEIENGHPREVMIHQVLSGPKFLEIFLDTVKQKIYNMYQYAEFMQIYQHDSRLNKHGILYFAVDQLEPKLSVLQYLLKHPPKVYHGCLSRGRVPKWFDDQKEETLSAACRRGNFKAYRALMESKPNHQTRKLLLDIVKGNSGKIADDYLQNNRRVSLEDKMAALHAVGEYGSHFVFDVLLQHITGGKQLKNISLLVSACKGGHIGIVSHFVTGVNLNQFHGNTTPLQEAVSGGHDEVVLHLLERGATLNVADDSGNVQDLGLIEHAQNLGFKNIVSLLAKHKQTTRQHSSTGRKPDNTERGN